MDRRTTRSAPALVELPQLREKPERRSPSRQPLPTCSQCGDAATRVVARSEQGMYVQCDACHHVQRPKNSRLNLAADDARPSTDAPATAKRSRAPLQADPER